MPGIVHMRGPRGPKESWRRGRTRGRERFGVTGERRSLYAGMGCNKVALPLEGGLDDGWSLIWEHEVVGGVNLGIGIVCQIGEIKWVDFIRVWVAERDVEGEDRGVWAQGG